MIRGEPRVSVIIPTFQRAHLVPRAVRSALAQTLREIEVLVVVDGGDPATLRALEEIRDPRLRTLVPPRRLGNADARNLGVERARGHWIAFLDDDDLWMPEKLERQLHAAEGSSYRHPIVACRLIGRSETQDFLWPRRAPRPGEPMSEYLFCRRTPFTGEGLIVTTTIFASRELLREVPLDGALPRFVDPDWLLRASRAEGVGVEFVADPAPLAVWHIEQGRGRLTNVKDWRYALRYGREHRELFTQRGYAAYLLHVVSHHAAARGAWRALPSLLREAFRHGRPASVDVLSHLGNFLVGDALRRWATAGFARLQWLRMHRGATPARLENPVDPRPT
jgi:glycosyltransferase involved in cell wall biosynthesis